MIAFHGDEKIKQKYICRLEDHIESNEIIKCQYWENGKGGAVGCTTHSNDYNSYEKELGIHLVLARLEDIIFVNLPNELAMTWPVRFLSAIPVGADLSKVWPKFAHWLLVDPVHGVVNFAKIYKYKFAIKRIAKVYFTSKTQSMSCLELIINRLFDEKSSNDNDSVASAASSAYYFAIKKAVFDATSDSADYAYAAATAAAAAATHDNVSAYSAAAYASYSSCHAAAAAYYYDSAYSAAASRYQAFIIQSEKLLELLRECK